MTSDNNANLLRNAINKCKRDFKKGILERNSKRSEALGVLFLETLNEFNKSEKGIPLIKLPEHSNYLGVEFEYNNKLFSGNYDTHQYDKQTNIKFLLGKDIKEWWSDSIEFDTTLENARDDDKLLDLTVRYVKLNGDTLSDSPNDLYNTVNGTKKDLHIIPFKGHVHYNKELNIKNNHTTELCNLVICDDYTFQKYDDIRIKGFSTYHRGNYLYVKWNESERFRTLINSVPCIDMASAIVKYNKDIAKISKKYTACSRVV